MIGIDWGTSSFRAFRLQGGAVLEQLSSAAGIMTVPESGFEAVLRAAIAPWLAQGESRVLMSGMIGSRQGWVEAAYLPCPVDAADIAAALTGVAFDGAELRIVPGLCAEDPGGTPEVMRGEETQIIGAGAEGLVCLPGSHAKWVRVTAGKIAGFATYLSGEAFAALRQGTILGRMMNDAPHDPVAFDRGVARSGEAGHLLHHLFGVRTLGLMGSLTSDASASYLSGLLIGHEIRAALPPGGHVTLLGAPPLCALYAHAIIALGGTASIGPADSAARGLALIGERATWT
jgi:2-dehydro-3-deoxygalactonokinase